MVGLEEAAGHPGTELTSDRLGDTLAHYFLHELTEVKLQEAGDKLALIEVISASLTKCPLLERAAEGILEEDRDCICI